MTNTTIDWGMETVKALRSATKPRYIPKGFIEYKPEIGDYPKDLFAVYTNINSYKSGGSPRLSAIFYTGKQSKHTWYYSFPTVTDMGAKINETISRLMSWEDKKVERKEARKNATSSVKVGQIYSYSWGYDQTNVEFYQVTEINGKTFTIREISAQSCGEAPSGSMSENVKPIKDAFLKDSRPILKRSLSMPHGCLSLTSEGEKHFMSWYA